MTFSSSLRRITYRHTIQYEVLNTSNILDPANQALLSVGRIENGRRFVVVDANVHRQFSPAIRAYFSRHAIDARIVSFPGGELSKTLAAYQTLARELDAFPIHRRDEPIIAIGGGVLTDVVGFLASTYRRGIPHINVPTTLMGYVDAAIGAKTGVNFDAHKNRLGSFAPPQRVLLDRAFLSTLPRRHLLNGFCEIIKVAVIKDADLFDLLERDGRTSVDAAFQDDPGGAILDRAIRDMLDELEANLLEENLCRAMDFGHTFSYGLETRPESNMLHGEAVLLDIALSTLIAQGRGLLAESEADRLFRLIADLGIAIDPALLDPAALWQSLVERTEHRNGFQRAPLPQGLGGFVFVNDISLDEIGAGIALLEERTAVQHDLL